MSKILTVIVPSYNMEALLPKCLESLVVGPELMDRFEVLVVNDGSTDHTSEIAHDFERRYPRTFKVVDKANGHYGSCINAALKVATGVFAKIVDADDAYDNTGFSSWLELVSRKLKDGSWDDVDLLLTNYFTVNEKDEILQTNTAHIAADRVLDISRIPRHYIFQMHAVAYRVEMLKTLGYVQTEGIMYTDTEWSVYPMAGVRKLYYWPHPVYRYFVGREGQSMDPAVFRRCVWQRVKMYMRMAREAGDEKWGAAAQYRMRAQAILGMRALYLKAMHSPTAEFNRHVQLIDDLVREHGADVYSLFDAITFSRPIPWRIVKAWRKRHCFNGCQIVITRWMEILLCLLGPVKNFVKKIVR